MTGVAVAFVEAADPRLQPLVVRIIEIMESAPFPLDAAVKWKRLTFALAGDYHHWICGIGVLKDSVTLEFHFGRLLDDPAGHFKFGSSRFLRKLQYRNTSEINEDVILDFVSQALNRLNNFKDSWKAIRAGATTD